MQKITSELSKERLLGYADTDMFKPHMMFRVPDTKNIKKGKPEVLTKLLQLGTSTPHEFKFEKWAPAEDPTPPKKSEGKTNYGEKDVHSILTECAFLTYAKENQKNA